MSMSNTTELAALAMFLQGTDPSYRASPTQYVALFTADPGEAGSLASECTYTGYARAAVTKATGWTGGANPFVNSGTITFAQCTAGSDTVTYFAVVDTGPAGGTAVNMMISGAVGSPLNVSSGIQPQFAAGVLAVGAD